MTLARVAKRLAVELSLPVSTTLVCRGYDSNIEPSTCYANALTDCSTASTEHIIIICLNTYKYASYDKPPIVGEQTVSKFKAIYSKIANYKISDLEFLNI